MIRRAAGGRTRRLIFEGRRIAVVVRAALGRRGVVALAHSPRRARGERHLDRGVVGGGLGRPERRDPGNQRQQEGESGKGGPSNRDVTVNTSGGCNRRIVKAGHSHGLRGTAKAQGGKSDHAARVACPHPHSPGNRAGDIPCGEGPVLAPAPAHRRVVGLR